MSFLNVVEVWIVDRKEEPRPFTWAVLSLNLDGTTEVLAGVDGIAAQLFLDTQNLIVFAKPFGTAWSSSFDLTSR